jgi:hypothetical protein
VPVCPAARACACARPGCRRPRRYPFDTADGDGRCWRRCCLARPARPPREAAPETHCRRAVVDAIRYVIHNGCVWRAVPVDFPLIGAPSTACTGGRTPPVPPSPCMTLYAGPARQPAATPNRPRR